jgi:ATP-dependent DNA helicase RecQ
MDLARKDLAELLHRTFGFPAFRANQEAVCRAATDGRDVLLVMPTGAGKSLCYQLPAIARGGTALVVSPLIALMDDQANKLTAAGLSVARIHSGLSRDQSRQACRDYLDGKLQFLFIAPERMRVPGFPEMLARRKPALIAIDEAHCISAWGHDFRPDYRTLGDHLPALRPAPIIALTATATPAVQQDIVAQLNLERPALFIHGFRRENLSIEVVELLKPRRSEFVASFLAEKSRRPAIVYAPSRKAAEELAGLLGRKYIAAAYHAGLEASVRERVQAQFQSGKVEVVVATIAFGMGIDKADVRTVIHFALPASVEAYYQEIGRAGRDGLPSRTILLYSFADRKMHDFFLERDYPVVNDLLRVERALTDDFLMPDYLASRLKMNRETVARALEKLAAQGTVQFDMDGLARRSPSATANWQSGYQQQVDFRRNQIDRMMQFAETQQCRMTALIKHFGDTADSSRPCGHCDFCAPSATTASTFAEPSPAQERDLRAILRALDGSTGKATGRLFTELGPDLRTAKDRKEFDALLDGLARAGLVQLVAESFTNPEGRTIPFKKASLTFEGQTLSPNAELGVVLRAESSATTTSPKRGKKAAVPHPSAASSRMGGNSEAKDHESTPLTEAQQALADNLRAWRKAEAAKTGKPAFIVFGDTALQALVQARPQSIPELLTVSGFGPDKADKYGAQIVALCRQPSLELTANLSVPHPSQVPASQRSHQGREREPFRDGWAVQPQLRQEPDSPKPPKPRPAAPPSLPRERTISLDASASPDPSKQDLEDRLRAWRKAESEKLGQPQFFVLGTTALRSIVLAHPRTLQQLENIEGIGPEKLNRFGPSILQVLNA